ncbi:MAG TPA: flagellar motor protein MotA [Alphaproteobacteria bacterium]|nr:flagellar motor protein MotA [Alphaproteobacteria bacterium]
MTRPYRFLFRMVLFLLAVIAVCVALRGGLTDAFLANPPLNGMIIGVLLLGIGYNFRQVLVLNPEVTWIEHFRRDQPKLSRYKPPRLLAPMATMLGERKGRVSLSAIATRSMLDSIGSRLDESRDISRYLIGLEIFLGLLGTFWGLLETVGAVSSVIGGLSTATDTAALFNDLQAGLKAPLSGMGTAFGTSLFGLAGSLVLGFLDLQASQAQNRFYNDLEEWLSSLTRLSSGGPLADGEQPVPAYIQALLEQTADNLENLQRTMAHAEESRGVNNTTLAGLADRLAQLTEQMRAEQSLLARLAEAQMELKPVLTRLADAAGRAGAGGDETLRTHLRNMEVYLARIIEDGVAGRAQMTQDLRNEIRLLARTIAALAEEEQR